MSSTGVASSLVHLVRSFSVSWALPLELPHTSALMYWLRDLRLQICWIEEEEDGLERREVFVVQFKEKTEGFSFQLLGLPPHALENLSHLEEIGIQLGKFKEKEGKEFDLSRTASVNGRKIYVFSVQARAVCQQR